MDGYTVHQLAELERRVAWLERRVKSPANYPEAITVSALATFGSERPGTAEGDADYDLLSWDDGRRR